MEYRTPECGDFQIADEMFVAAWRAELPELRRRALRLAAGQRDRAEDLIADTAIKALLFMRRSPDAMTDPRGFLYVVLRHVFLDAVRRGKREAETIDRGAAEGAVENAAGQGLAAPQWLELHDQLHRVVAAVAELSRDQRRLFAYRFVEDLPYPVIAARLRITQPLARKRVQLLRQRLKAASDE
ncbi:RNA polymerase sigma factor [Luteimonas sp. RD2P54]|uniref:RNA polymerase sigma factor n=1 Tax=Luteimonas endophytica TaxID=3042023 RepID=A0ABT6JDM0_9GAMM|nr:RNA polymerase sigma factor [Luteimonas endophytica]MDH5824824.1 RNA polymerase sigma factor [Luteimonas endophytica]